MRAADTRCKQGREAAHQPVGVGRHDLSRLRVACRPAPERPSQVRQASLSGAMGEQGERDNRNRPRQTQNNLLGRRAARCIRASGRLWLVTRSLIVVSQHDVWPRRWVGDGPPCRRRGREQAQHEAPRERARQGEAERRRRARRESCVGQAGPGGEVAVGGCAVWGDAGCAWAVGGVGHATAAEGRVAAETTLRESEMGCRRTRWWFSCGICKGRWHTQSLPQPALSFSRTLSHLVNRHGLRPCRYGIAREDARRRGDNLRERGQQSRTAESLAAVVTGRQFFSSQQRRDHARAPEPEALR